LALADLANVKPHYNCNVTVNRWRKYDAEYEQDYEVLTLSPSYIERIDRGEYDLEFNQKGFIEPKDIRLSSAMITSASALSYDQGMLEHYDRSYRDIKAFLGFGIGKHQVAQTGLTRDWMSWVRTSHFVSLARSLYDPLLIFVISTYGLKLRILVFSG